MKQTLFLAVLLTAFQPVFSQKKKIDPRISDVTVFLSGAQVTHSGDITLKEGENVLFLSDLPLYMDPNSVQVEGNPNYTILSVRHQVNYLNDATTNPEIKEIQDKLDDLQFKRRELIGLKNVVQQEKALLENNRNIGGNNSTLLAEDLAEMADFYRERFKNIEYRWLELEVQENETVAEITRLQNQLNALNTRKGTNPSEVVITLIAKKEAKANIRVSYVVQNAGWIPVYDLRVEDINKPVEFAYRARVFQSTGNDWNDVNLTISTGNPSVGGQAPILYPWFINFYQPVAVYDKKVRAESAPSAAYGWEQRDDSGAAYNQLETAASYTSVQQSAVSTEFVISVPYDIPSDNQQYDVTMQHDEFKAEYAYITIPKMDNDAFLRARVTDWMQYALLPGESNIYFRGTFVSKGYIDPAMAIDTLDLSLGRDRSIQVKREQIKEFCKTSAFAGKQKTTKAYEITVTNTKKEAVEVVIEDQIPISQNSEIEVETEELSGGAYDAKTGKVTWKVSIPPGQTIKKQLRFNVKYPKKKYIGNL